MFLAALNKPKQLLHLNYIGHVRAEDLVRERDNAAALLAELPAGFRLLADLERLESMDPGCATEIGKFMELCDRKGVGLVVRVIPDPKKDIGLNILSLFHHAHRPRTATCRTMTEAARLLSL